jgi:hypothetical protein
MGHSGTAYIDERNRESDCTLIAPVRTNFQYNSIASYTGVNSTPLGLQKGL